MGGGTGRQSSWEAEGGILPMNWQSVRGPGVWGAGLALAILPEPLQEPVLSKEQPAFQYSSHVSLQASSGHMW